MNRDQKVDIMLGIIESRLVTPFFDFASKEFGDEPKDRKIAYELRDFMLSKSLIKKLNNEGTNVSITPFGRKIFDNEGWQKFVHKQQLKLQQEKKQREKELKKLDLDIELNEKVVKDYPTTKRISNWGIFLAAIAIIAQLIQIVIELMSTD